MDALTHVAFKHPRFYPKRNCLSESVPQSCGFALKTMYENAARYSEIREHSHDTTVLEEKIRDAFCQVIFFSSEHCDGFADDESDLQYVIVCNMRS